MIFVMTITAEWQRGADRVSICKFTLEMHVMAKLGPGWSQKPGTQSEYHVVAGTKLLERLSAVSEGVCFPWAGTVNRTGNGTKPIWYGWLHGHPNSCLNFHAKHSLPLWKVYFKLVLEIFYSTYLFLDELQYFVFCKIFEYFIIITCN